MSRGDLTKERNVQLPNRRAEYSARNDERPAEVSHWTLQSTGRERSSVTDETSTEMKRLWLRKASHSTLLMQPLGKHGRRVLNGSFVPRPTCPRRKSVDGNDRWRGLLARYIEHCMYDRPTQWHQYQSHCVDQYPDVLLCGSNEAPACLISSFISSFIIPFLRLSSRCSYRLLVLQLLLCITAAVGMGLLHGELWTDWRLMYSQLTYQRY